MNSARKLALAKSSTRRVHSSYAVSLWLRSPDTQRAAAAECRAVQLAFACGARRAEPVAGFHHSDARARGARSGRTLEARIGGAPCWGVARLAADLGVAARPGRDASTAP